MRSVANCLFVVAILAFPAMAEDPGREGPAKNVILFGWDGAQREHVQHVPLGLSPWQKRNVRQRSPHSRCHF